MKYKIRDCGVILLFVILLPYVFTVLAQGKDVKQKTDTVVGKETGSAENTISIRTGETEISFRDYLIGVVMGCIPADSEPEACKAQMVIARTAALAGLKEGREASAEDLKQNYVPPEVIRRSIGYEAFQDFYRTLDEAERETEMEILTYEGEPIDAAYHAVSAGKTRSMDTGEFNRPYLKSVESAWDIESEQYLNISYMTEEEYAGKAEKIAGLEAGELERPLEQTVIGERDEAGYVVRLKIGEHTVGGEEFRSSLGLASACFVIDRFDGKIRFTVKGLGHGAGLSQYGANAMAKEGKSYRQILQYYYKNIEISRLSE